MKRLIVLIVAVVFAGCMLDAPIQTGTVVINFPSRATIAADLAGVDLDYTVARVWLTSGKKRIDIDGVEYKDSDGGSVIITGLIPDVYGVQVSFGKSSDGYIHSVVAYGESEPFTISKGVTSNVTVKLLPQIVYSETATVGEAYVDVVTIGNDLYTLASDGTLFENGVAFTDPALTGKRIQSITKGAFFATAGTLADELWINTADGIYPLRNGVIVEDFTSGLSVGSGGLDIESTFHYLQVDAADSTSNAMIVFAQGTGLDSLFGTYFTYADSDDPSSWEWYGWDALDEVAGLGEIKDALTAVGEVVYDLEFDDRMIVAATALQTFLLPEESIGELIDYFDTLDDPAADMNLETVLGFLYVVTVNGSDGQAKTIKSVEIESTYLYLGTNTANDPGNGLFVAPIDAQTGAVTADAQLIAETEGKEGIIEIGHNPAIGMTYARASSTLYILKDGALTKQIPSYAGLPGTLLDSAWDETASRLYLAGTEGVSYLSF